MIYKKPRVLRSKIASITDCALHRVPLDKLSDSHKRWIREKLGMTSDVYSLIERIQQVYFSGVMRALFPTRHPKILLTGVHNASR